MNWDIDRRHQMIKAIAEKLHQEALDAVISQLRVIELSELIYLLLAWADSALEQNRNKFREFLS